MERLGIEAVANAAASCHSLPPADEVLSRTTYHAVYDVSILDALRYAHDNGFAGIQVAAELPHLSPLALDDASIDQIAAYRFENGLLLSLHGPDECAGLRVADACIAQGALTYLARLFNVAERLGAHIVTLHVGALPRYRTDLPDARQLPADDAAVFAAALATNLRRVAGMAAGRSLACIENAGLGPRDADAIDPLVSKGFLHLAWDHRKPDPDGYYESRSGCVRQAHLHGDRDGASHVALDPTDLEAIEWVRRLATCDVREYCIEVRPRERALDSLHVLRDGLYRP